jgi:hypothetical protein
MESGVAITTDVIVGGKAGDVRSFATLSNLVKCLQCFIDEKNVQK